MVPASKLVRSWAGWRRGVWLLCAPEPFKHFAFKHTIPQEDTKSTEHLLLMVFMRKHLFYLFGESHDRLRRLVRQGQHRARDKLRSRVLLDAANPPSIATTVVAIVLAVCLSHGCAITIRF